MDYGKHFYITLFSNASQKIYPRNTIAEFTVQLAQRIDLGSTDSWDVGHCEFSCPPPAVGALKPIDVIGETNALVYCDLIAPQFVRSQHARCLRTFIHETNYCGHTFKYVYYIPDEKHAFQEISIVIVDLRVKKIPFKSGDVPVKVVLHFRRV
jgi:hypothetical protein